MARILSLKNALHKTSFWNITPPLNETRITKESVLSLFERINRYEKLLANEGHPEAEFDASLWELLVGTFVTFNGQKRTHAYEYEIEKEWKDGEPSDRGVLPFSTGDLLENETRWNPSLLFGGFLEASEVMVQSVLHGSLNRGYRSISVLFKEPAYDDTTIFRLLGRHPVTQLSYLPKFFSLEKLVIGDEFKTPELNSTIFQRNDFSSFVVYKRDLVHKTRL